MMTVQARPHVSVPEGTRPRNRLGNPGDRALMADWLAAGTVIGHGFANFYAITARPELDSVRRVNRMKGRPAGQVGSVTVPPTRVADLFDWSGTDRRRVLGVIDAFYARGPFGFRGPAAAHLPEHLTSLQDGIRTTQVIAPGYACPSNAFLAQCLDAAGTDFLYVTSANRSRHRTGADDSPAHWRAAGLSAEFGHEPDFALLEHDDEDLARAAYPHLAPMSTSVLSFHHAGPVDEMGRATLTLERHGSMEVDEVRAVLADLGLGLTLGPGAKTRLTLRTYP